jgi:hypothetical protein
MDRSYSEEGRRIHGKTSIGLDSTGNQKERKIESNLKNYRFGRSRKMLQNMKRV